MNLCVHLQSSPIKTNQTVNPSVHFIHQVNFIIYNHKYITAPPCFQLLGEWTLTGMAARGLPKSCRWATSGTLTAATPWDLVSDEIQQPSSDRLIVLQWFFQSKMIKGVNNGDGATLTIQSKHLETPPSETETGLNENVKVNVRSLP